MSSNLQKLVTKACLLSALVLPGGISLVHGQNVSASESQQTATEPMLAEEELQDFCSPDTIQTLTSQLSIKTSAKQIEDGPKFSGGVKFVAAKEKVPAFCQISGTFVSNPATGKTANFLATFPANWNHKFLQIGCSGLCGNFFVSDAAGSQIVVTSQGAPGESIIKGYASFATDEGHTTPFGGEWAAKGPGQVDQDALDDFYYRADQLLAQMGKSLTIKFYSAADKVPQKIAHSYFIGCSGGGRDALVAASIFPEEYDGIIAGSPYLNPAGVAFQTAGITLSMIRSADADVTPELMSKVDPFVKAKCDALDGVEDGLIQNPAACNFLPSRDLPLCDAKPAQGVCFTQSQVESISTVVTAVTDEHGKVVQPGYSVSDLQASARMPRPADPTAADPWPTNTPTTGLWGLSDGVEKIFVHQNDPNFHTRQVIKFDAGGRGPITSFRTVVPQAEAARAMAATRLGSGDRPAEIAKLIKEKKKLLIWANLSDQQLSPYMSVNYYKTLAKTYGGYAKLQDSVRLFLLPDTAHCSISGCGPDNFDALAAMENWVENRQAPDGLLAAQYVRKGNVVGAILNDYSKPPIRTMPLCKFPEMAHYGGKGDVKEAANWSCPANDTSMLKVGESGRQAGVIE